jgi:hypothetical protein
MSVAPLHQNNAFHNDPKFGRLLLVSLIVHGLIWVAFSGSWFGASARPKPPVYTVDLVHKPVLNPQAGRPDPRPVKKPKAAAVKRKAPVVIPPTPKVSARPAVKPKAKPVKTVKPKPVPKPAPKPVAKPDQRKQQKVQSALDEIRERQARQTERDALKDKLAKLRDSVGAAATVPTDVPVGMLDGTGDDVGVAVVAFVQEFIQQNWALSPYLLDQSRLANFEAKASLRYSKAGKLMSYRVDQLSGNKQFDDSLKRAIIKSQQLPQALPKDLNLIVIFNLKDMAAAR